MIEGFEGSISPVVDAFLRPAPAAGETRSRFDSHGDFEAPLCNRVSVRREGSFPY
jgi:hypothetical protein